MTGAAWNVDDAACDTSDTCPAWRAHTSACPGRAELLEGPSPASARRHADPVSAASATSVPSACYTTNVRRQRARTTPRGRG